MRYELLDFQQKASNELIADMKDMQDNYHQKGRCSFVLLTAPTGSGKTVISAAVAEGLLYGNDTTNDDPNAVILWLSDNPALNEQTKHKFAVSSDMLNENVDLQIIDETFAKNHRKLEKHHVYFLNRQKLSSRAKLSIGAEGGYTFWDVITNTIEDVTTNLYLMIDEAHIGLGSTGTSDSENATIYAKLIDGQTGINPKMPVVVGISATPARFEKAMKGRQERIRMPMIKVSNADVRKAGIIKDMIELRSPKKSLNAISQDLEQACQQLIISENHWKDYCRKEDIPAVIPLMIIQVEDKVSDEVLSDICKNIKRVMPNLGINAFANCFGEHTDRDNAFAKIPYVTPDEVQDRTEIRILFAKDAISTGWDCPRAEVLYSRRKRTDKTYIQQMLGRMIRTPLAQRIGSDDFLNAVSAYLPEYDEESVKEVARIIAEDGDIGETTNTTVNPERISFFGTVKKTAETIKTEHILGNSDGAVKEYHKATINDCIIADGIKSVYTNVELSDSDTDYNVSTNVDIDETVLDEVINNMPATSEIGSANSVTADAIKQSFEGIVSRRVSDTHADDYATLFGIINILTGIEAPDGTTWENDNALSEEFYNQIESAITAHPIEFARDLHSAMCRPQMILDIGLLKDEEEISVDEEEIEIDDNRLETMLNAVIKKFGNRDYIKGNADDGVGAVGYVNRCIEKGMTDKEAVKRIVGAVSCFEIMADIALWAQQKSKSLICKHNPNKGRMKDDERAEWERYTASILPYVDNNLSMPVSSIKKAKNNAKGYKKHIFVGSDGLAHMDLKPIEQRVVEKEIADPYNIAWYRNEARNLQYGMAIPYYDGKCLQNMFPDFIFFEKTNNGSVIRNIIDPHGEWLGDSLAKLKGYVKYLKDYPDMFAKVLAVTDVTENGVTEYRSLDLKDNKVIDAIEKASTSKELFHNCILYQVYLTVR